MNPERALAVIMIAYILFGFWLFDRYDRQLTSLENQLAFCGEALAESLYLFDQLSTIHSNATEEYERKLDILSDITVTTSMDSGQFLNWFRVYAESFGFHACIE